MVEDAEREEDQRRKYEGAPQDAFPRRRVDLPNRSAPAARRFRVAFAVPARVPLRRRIRNIVDLDLVSLFVDVDELVVVPELFLAPAALLPSRHQG